MKCIVLALLSAGRKRVHIEGGCEILVMNV